MQLINNTRQAINLDDGTILAAAGFNGSIKEVEAISDRDRKRYVDTAKVRIAPEPEPAPVKIMPEVRPEVRPEARPEARGWRPEVSNTTVTDAPAAEAAKPAKKGDAKNV